MKPKILSKSMAVLFGIALFIVACKQNKKEQKRAENVTDVVLEARETSKTWAEKLGWPAGKKVIMLHADDIGMCPEANTAAKKQLEAGDIQSAAVMIPCPNAEDFITYAKNNPKMDIGLHLTSVSYTHLRAHETDSYLVCR